MKAVNPSAVPFAVSMLLAATAMSGHAETLADRFDVHGYGDQTYMRTSANAYDGADRSGGWGNNFFGLVVATTLTDKSKLWTQIQASSSKGNNVTWMFVDYQVSDAVRLHAGRVKLPLGFYNEYIDAKSLQLSALEPGIYQTFRTGADMVHDAYEGAGADFEGDAAGGHVLVQAWGGNIHDTDPPSDSRDRRAWGGRITYDTPISGLSTMLSAYRQQVEILADGAMTREDRAIASIGYLGGNWNLKAEYAWHSAALHETGGRSYSCGYYLQAGYAVDEKWTPYARFDDIVLDRERRNDPSYRQKTAVVGVAYRLSERLGLRAEGHLNRGYALPVATGEVQPGDGAKTWKMFVASVNVQF
jgi:hypothetical protein